MKNLFSMLRDKIKLFGLLLLFFSLFFGFLLYSSEITQSIYSSISFCMQSLFPSLFPFVALTAFAVQSRIGDVIGSSLGFITKYLFRLPKSCTAAVIMGMLGGYPSGAAGISTLLEKDYITRKQAGRMLLFCVNPGIAFVISFVGKGILKNTQTGLLLFCSILLASIFLGVLTGIFVPIPKDEPPQPEPAGASTSIIHASVTAARSLLRMVVCILLFSSILAILKHSGLLFLFSSLLGRAANLSQTEAKGLLLLLSEITTGISYAARYRLPTLYYPLALAFGGLCVHMQLFTFFSSFPISKTKFFLFRIFHAVLSLIIFAILSARFPQSTLVYANTALALPITAEWRMPFTGGFCLLLMCAAFLLILTKSSDSGVSRLAEKK